MERNVTDLLFGKEGEPIKVGKKVIKTPDSQTTITYELMVNPRTGQQEVVENIETTKKECAICNGHFAQINNCADCHNQICASDSRKASEYIGRQHFPKIVCKSCAKSYGIKD